MTPKPPDCWPTELEALLLQAGLWDPPRALEAWDTFCRRIDAIETLGNECYRLFPLVAANLQGSRKEIPHMDRIFGVLRHSWARNQKLLGQIVPLLLELQRARIDFLVLKGAALSSLYYKNTGVRPMEDVDILIHPRDLPVAARLLQELGCAPPFALTMERISELLTFRHELTLRGPAGQQLDVHWYLVSDSRHSVMEDSLWRHAAPCPLPGVAARTLSPADQMLHTCLHGVQWNEVSASRWLSDAVVIIRGGLDWDRLEAQARALRRLQPVRETLLYLDRLEMNLPSTVVEHWRRMEITDFEKLEGGYRALRPNPKERTKQLAWVYLRLNPDLSALSLFRRAPAYMRQLHHFRAYSRRFKFIGYLLFLCLTRRESRPECFSGPVK